MTVLCGQFASENENHNAEVLRRAVEPHDLCAYQTFVPRVQPTFYGFDCRPGGQIDYVFGPRSHLENVRTVITLKRQGDKLQLVRS